MGKKIKFREVESGEVYYIDEEDCSKGPVKIAKPEGNYITPSGLSGVGSKSYQKKTHLSHSERLRLSALASKDIDENGYGDVISCNKLQ